MALKQVSGGELSTVGEYDVKFASSGVTDGGLTFGASITLDGRVDNSIAGDGFAAYIGGADGSWKLQFGDNDEGIATVGGFGVADPDDGAFGTKEMFHDTAAVPGTEVTITEAVEAMPGQLAGGMIMVADDLTLSKVAEASLDDADDRVIADSKEGDGNVLTVRTGVDDATVTFLAAEVEQVNDLDSRMFYFKVVDDAEDIADERQEYAGMRIYRHNTNLAAANNTAEDAETPDAEVTPADKKFTLDVKESDGYMGPTDAETEIRGGSDAMTSLVTEPSSLKVMALSGSVASVSYALTAGTGDAQGWSFGTKYDAGVVTVGLGMNSNSVLSASVGGSVTNIGYEFIYVRQSGMTREAPDEGEGDMGIVGVNNWNAYGLKGSYEIGSDSDVAVKYSKLTDKNGNAGGAMNATQIEVDYNYGLGGGASFFVEYDRVSETMGDDDDRSRNTIQAGIKMSF